MNVKKMFVLGAGVALVAAGCTKNPQAQVPPAAQITQPKTTALNIAPELDPSQGWIRFYPGESLKFNLLFPTAWWGDDGGTDSHFVLRSRKGADGSRVDDVIMDFTVGPTTAKGLVAQVTTDMKGFKDASPVTTAKTDSGVPYAFATYIDAAGKPTLGVAVQYLGTQYVYIKITGNVAYPYVGRMIQSIAVKQ